MSCIYNGFDGKCELFDSGFQNFGCDENGICVCDEDPDPSYTCESFENIDPGDSFDD